MTNKEKTIEAFWEGPFSWPGYEKENNLLPIPEKPGIYLQTFKYYDGFLIYAAGITLRTILKRFGEHTRNYLNGEYNVLDIGSAERGIRKEIWHGWGYARENREEFEEKKGLIQEAVHKQLSGFSIFTCNIGRERRVLERLEASIMNSVYNGPGPICDFPDRGMYLSSRWDSEKPIIVKNITPEKIYGLPGFLII